MANPFFFLFAFLFVLLILVIATVLAGVLAGLVTAPVLWWTGYGLVPYEYAETAESRAERSVLIVGHVVGCAVCFVTGGFLSVLAGVMGAEVWIGFVIYPFVLAAAWVAFVARPLYSREDVPDHWIRDSVASFFVYALAFLGVLAGLAELFGSSVW